MSRFVGLGIHLSGGNAATFFMTEERAREVITLWKSNHYKLKNINVGSDNEIGPMGTYAWSIAPDAILGMQTFDIPPQQQPVLHQNTPNPWGGAGRYGSN